MMYDVLPTRLMLRKHAHLELENLPHREAVISLPPLFFKLKVLGSHSESEW